MMLLVTLKVHEAQQQLTTPEWDQLQIFISKHATSNSQALELMECEHGVCSDSMSSRAWLLDVACLLIKSCVVSGVVSLQVGSLATSLSMACLTEATKAPRYPWPALRPPCWATNSRVYVVHYKTLHVSNFHAELRKHTASCRVTSPMYIVQICPRLKSILTTWFLEAQSPFTLGSDHN